MALAASSISLLTLPQTDAPGDNLPQGEERSEQFVLEVSEYFERLDVRVFPSSQSHTLLKVLSISRQFMLLYVLRLLISGIHVLHPLPSMRLHRALYRPLSGLASPLMAVLLAKTEDSRKKESSAIHGKTSSPHLLA